MAFTGRSLALPAAKPSMSNSIIDRHCLTILHLSFICSRILLTPQVFLCLKTLVKNMSFGWIKFRACLIAYRGATELS